MRRATHADHEEFCRLDGWVRKVGARGKENAHSRYEKRLPGGEILRTKISRGGTGIDDPKLWKRILREQLRVSEDEFWAVLAEKRPANRGAAPAAEDDDERQEDLPAYVIDALLRAGLPDDEIMQMSCDEAVGRLHDLWSQQTDSS